MSAYSKVAKQKSIRFAVLTHCSSLIRFRKVNFLFPNTNLFFAKKSLKVNAKNRHSKGRSKRSKRSSAYVRADKSAFFQNFKQNKKNFVSGSFFYFCTRSTRRPTLSLSPHTRRRNILKPVYIKRTWVTCYCNSITGGTCNANLASFAIYSAQDTMSLHRATQRKSVGAMTNSPSKNLFAEKPPICLNVDVLISLGKAIKGKFFKSD